MTSTIPGLFSTWHSLNELKQIKEEQASALKESQVSSSATLRKEDSGSTLRKGTIWSGLIGKTTFVNKDIRNSDSSVKRSSSTFQSKTSPNTTLSTATAKSSFKKKLAISSPDSGVSLPVEKESPDVYKHLLVNIVPPITPAVGEDAELHFAIYNAEEEQYITEDFIIQIETGKEIQDPKIQFIFKDLQPRDLISGKLYLSCKIVKRGKLTASKEKRQGSFLGTGFLYRRPFGQGLIHLPAEFWFGDRSVDGNFSFFMAPSENGFASIPNMIINKSSNAQPTRQFQVCVGVRVFSGDYRRLCKVPGFPSSDAAPIVRKIGWPDLPLPTENRQDVYIVLHSGDFPQETIELTLELRNENGNVMEKCWQLGVGDKAQHDFRSVVLYHVSNPTFQEVAKLTVPAKCHPKTHILLQVRYCSEEKQRMASSFSFLKLFQPDGSAVQDAEHTIPFYKLPPYPIAKPFYLDDIPADLLQRKPETVKLRMVIASNFMPQSPSVVKLAAWKEKPDEAKEALKRFEQLEQSDISKHLFMLLDAVFALQEDPSTSLLAFNSFNFVVRILMEDRTYDYEPIFEEYVQKCFNNPNSFRHLMASLSYFFNSPDPASNSTRIKLCLKGLKIISKLIVKSREQFCAANPQSEIQNKVFEVEILQLANTLVELMTKNLPKTLNIHTLALKNVCSMLLVFQPYVEVAKLVEVGLQFLRSIPITQAEVPLIADRFSFLTQFIMGLKSEDSFPDLIQQAMLYIKEHLDASSYPVPACFELCGALVDAAHSKKMGATAMNVAPFLPVFLKLVSSQRQYPDPREQLIDIVFIGLLSVLVDSNLVKAYLNGIEEQDKMATLLNLLQFCEIQVSSTIVFPEQWPELMVLVFNVVSKVIRDLFEMIQPLVAQATSAESEILLRTVNTLAKFLGSKQVLADQKKAEFASKIGDLRGPMIQCLSSLWKCLNPDIQAEFMGLLIPPVLRTMLSQSNSVKQTAFELYVEFIKCAQAHPKLGILFVEHRSIEDIESMAGEGLLDEHFQSFFMNKLAVKFTEDPTLREGGQKFLRDVTNQTGLLFELVTIPAGAAHDDYRVFIITKLLDYLKQANKQSVYLKYIHQLAHIHASGGSYSEAGFALLKHAETLEFNDEPLEPLQVRNVSFAAQTKRQRKEQLYNMAVEHFIRGKSWERALQLLQELVSVCEAEYFEFNHVTQLLRKEAQLYRYILETERLFGSYFRVVFLGRGFPDAINGKEFIYAAAPGLMMADFMTLLQTQYPGSEIIKPTVDLTQEDWTQKELSYLLVVNVTPIEPEQADKLFDEQHRVKLAMKSSRESTAGLVNKNLPTRMKKYYKNNEVNLFLYSRAFNKNPNKKSENPFEDLWLSNTYFWTAEAFPCCQRRLEIVKKDEITVSPVENALNSIISRNNELADLIDQYDKEDRPQNVNPLSMLLNGSIDAAVNGGVSKYHEVFFSPDFMQKNPDKLVFVEGLKQALNDHVDLLSRGLQVHSAAIPEDMRAMQDKLETFFSKMQAEISQSGRYTGRHTSMKKERGSVTIETPQPTKVDDKWKKLLGM